LNHSRHTVLWSVFTHRESFQLLREVWPQLGEKERMELIKAVLKGPPREMYRAEISEEEWAGIRDRDVWERLCLLNEAGPPLQGDGANVLKRISDEHPNWELSGPRREGFVAWSERGSLGFRSAFTPDQIISMDWPTFRQTLTDLKNLNRGMADSLRQATLKNPKRIVGGLLLLARTNEAENDYVNAVLQASLNVSSAVARRMLMLLSVLESVVEVLHSSAFWLSDIAKKLPESDELKFLFGWTRIWTSSGHSSEQKDNRPREERIPLHEAINHTCGLLAEALLNRVWSRAPKGNDSIPEPLRPAFTSVAEADTKRARYAHVVLSAHLHPLFLVDPAWTKQYMLPWFDWDYVGAANMWDAYLANPQMSLGLYQLIGESFFGAFGKTELLSNKNNLARLLTAIAIDGTEELSSSDVRQALRNAGPEGRAAAGEWLFHRIRRDQPANPYVVEKIIRWLTAGAWPPDLGPEPKFALHLAGAAIYTGDLFPKAVQELRRFWTPVEHIGSLPYQIEQSGVSKAHPHATAQLLALIAPVHLPGYEAQSILSLLREIVTTDPSVAGQHNFIALKERCAMALV
jgi:hypothetical protein